MYEATEEAIKLHRSAVIGGQNVGLGGAVTKKDKTVLPEATPAQYEIYFKNRDGKTPLVREVEKKSKA